MKKLNKLFAILIAVLGVNTLSAQIWTAPVIGQDLKDVNNNTELYMYNVKADAFACSGMSWGTHATVKELQNGDTKLSADVHRCRVSKPTDGQLQIMLNEKQWLGGVLSNANDCWVDYGSNNVYIYNEVSDNVYTLKPTTATNDSYLDCAWAYGGHITFSATNGYGNTEWAFVLRTDITNGKYLLYKAKKEMYDIYQALVEAGHDGTYADALATANAAYTASDATATTVNTATKVLLKAVAPALSSKYFTANSLFNNPDMRGYGDDTDWGDGLNAFANGIFESWHSAETITQKQTGLPNGFYTVVFLGMYRQDGSDAAPTLTLTSGSNSAKASLKALTEIDFGSIQGAGKNANNADDWISNKPNNTYGAGEALAHTDAGVKVENFVVENGELTVTVAMPSTSQWLLCQGVQIYFKAESLEEYANLFNEALEAAEAIDATKLNTYAAGVLSTALGNAANEQVDKDWYQARVTELNNAIALANAVVTPYANVTNLIDLCTEYASPQNSNANSEDVLSTFNTAISTATTAANEATTADALNAVYNTLESARQAYAQNAVPVYPYPFDMTFLLPNTTFDNNIDGWTKTGGANWMAAGRNVECYNTTFEFSMEYTGLNSGSWEIQVDAFYRYGGYNDAETAHNEGTEQLHATLYANNNTVAVKSIMEGANKAGSIGATTTGGMHVPNAPADCDAYFATECYTNAIATVIADGKLKVGIKKETTQGADWTIFDNFKLIYKGIDVTDLQNALSELIKKADVIKDEKMGAAESATLSTALDNADATVTNADRLSEMISNLQSAYDNAAASISTYAAVSAYIAKANKINESIAASYQTQYDNGTIEGDAETVRQALNVATFNYVDKVFGNEIVLTDWGAASNAMWSTSGEHWDGTTGEGATSYYDANGTNTTHTLSKTVELTPGTYIFRGAGRSNTNTTLTLSIDIDGIEPVVFNPKGNTGRGIDKEGKATFADDAEYARNGQGQGWEWEFIKFTLKETTTVTLTATCKTSGSGWASFANNGLWMDDATYVEANAGAITAPKNEAEALVDTKPMGATENTALANAIAQAKETLNTPEKLNAAIEALETAVANANAWLIAYNEAKAPLVEALERFEADFNNGNSGCLYHLQTSVWDDVINKVQTAAVVKDDTDSYEDFAEAANNLNTALDEAQVSIDMYAKLKAEIGYAEEYTPIIAENVDAHTTAVNTANDVYEAAETVDSVYVETLIANMQQYKVSDYTYVMDNYNKAVALGEWTGSTGTGKGEHWSGNAETAYFDYSRWSGDAKAYEATQTITLPAGEYVLMAAGRAADVEGTEAYIKVNETKVNFATKSSYGHGIDTDGKANFSADGTYGRSNEGYGWEYRFIEFSLATESDVTLTAGMKVADSYNPLSWAGVCTPVLLTPDLDIAYEELQAAIDACQPIWNDVETEYESSILPDYQNACTNRSYNFVSDIKAATEEVKVAFAEYVRNTANDTDRSLAFTERIVNASCEDNVSWDGSGRSTMTGEHWSGDAERVYFAQNHQNGAARTQTITLPYKGVYLLKVAVRAVAANSYAEILVNGKSHKTMGAHGRTGGTIATDGTEWESVEAGIAAGKTFANNNAGFGWVYDYICFETATADESVTIAINLSDKDNHKAEGNCGGMELYFIGKNYSAVEGNAIVHYGEYSEAITATHTTHDVTSAKMNNPAVDVTANPNVLIIANEGQVSNENNVIVAGTAASLVLNDGGHAFNTAVDFTAAELSYAREFTKGTWLTVCLPFAYEIPENVKVETLGAIDLDTKTFTFDEVLGTMEANKPYLIKNSTEVAALFESLSDVEVKVTPTAMNVTITAENSEHQGEFIGTYTTVESDALMEDGAYDILFFGTDGQLYYLSQGVTTKNITIKPFRAYIRLPKNAINWSDGQQARVRHRNSEMTDIDTLESADNSQQTTVIYDMQGRRVMTMVKGGMYIVNGKKVVVR